MHEVGGCRAAIGDAARYAKQRKQFGQPIAGFGAIKHKLGEMTARTYAIESLTYRTAGLIDASLSDHDGPSVAKAFEEYAVEASISKVGGTETLDYVLDGTCRFTGQWLRQGHRRSYIRRARQPHFEAHEINRMRFRACDSRALKGDVPMIAAAQKLQDSESPTARVCASRTNPALAKSSAWSGPSRKSR